MDFLKKLGDHLPFAIHRFQTDNDSSFEPQFTWHLSDFRISHRHTPPRCPEVNGKVERCDKTHAEGFDWKRAARNKRDLSRKLKCWEKK
jgi:transposase InsO family protein